MIAKRVADRVRRAWLFFAREGLVESLRQVPKKAKRALLERRNMMFYAVPEEMRQSPNRGAYSCLIVRSPGEVPSALWEKMAGYVPREAWEKILRRRFDLGAEMWVALKGDDPLGFGWTVRGKDPDGLRPVLPDERFIFDAWSFPGKRGLGIMNFLIEEYRKACLAEGGCRRIYFVTMEWNRPMARTAARAGFKPYGAFLKVSVFGRAFTHWLPEGKTRDLFAKLSAGRDREAP